MFDIELCIKYLDAPREHWIPAAEADAWIAADAVAESLANAAKDALKNKNHANASFAMSSLKGYALRTCPEHAESVVPAVFARALPETISAMRSEGVPEEIIRDTLSDYGTWARYYLKHNSLVGIGEFRWEVRFHSGCIVKLGRIQYETYLYPAPYTFYRRRSTGEIIPVLHDGEGVNEYGYLALKDPAAFASTMKVEDGVLVCNKIDTRTAQVKNELVRYAMDDLELLITTGMPVLNMHIPETGPLTPESVSESLKMARDYFTNKGYPAIAAVCESWLLDPALQEYGISAKNILSFQNRFALYPWIGAGSEAVGRVFGRGTDVSDPDALPGDTSLRRGLRAYLKTGKPLRDTGGLLIISEI